MQRRKVSLLQVCRALRQEFRSLLLRTPLVISLDAAAKYVTAFYPLLTPFPAETEIPPCRITLTQSTEPGLVYLAPLLKLLYDRPALDFLSEQPWPGDSLGAKLNFLFADKKRAPLWKAALHSTVTEIIYSETHTYIEYWARRSWKTWGTMPHLHILLETHGVKLPSIIEDSKSPVPLRLKDYLSDLGLVQRKRGVIKVSSSHNARMSRRGELRGGLRFDLNNETR